MRALFRPRLLAVAILALSAAGCGREEPEPPAPPPEPKAPLLQPVTSTWNLNLRQLKQRLAEGGDPAYAGLEWSEAPVPGGVGFTSTTELPAGPVVTLQTNAAGRVGAVRMTHLGPTEIDARDAVAAVVAPMVAAIDPGVSQADLAGATAEVGAKVWTPANETVEVGSVVVTATALGQWSYTLQLEPAG